MTTVATMHTIQYSNDQRMKTLHGMPAIVSTLSCAELDALCCALAVWRRCMAGQLVLRNHGNARPLRMITTTLHGAARHVDIIYGSAAGDREAR